MTGEAATSRYPKTALDDIGPIVATLADLTVRLTIAIAWVAITRLAFYEDAFGLTMLRLACMVVAWWIIAVLMLVGVAILRHDRGPG